MRISTILSILVTIIIVSSCQKNKVTKVPLPEGFIENDWDATLLAAQNNDRNVFVHFYADWCSLCAAFKEDVLNDADVENYMQNQFIGASLDSEKEPGLTQFNHFNLSGHPNLIVTDKNGILIGQHLGKMNKTEFMDWIEDYE